MTNNKSLHKDTQRFKSLCQISNHISNYAHAIPAAIWAWDQPTGCWIAYSGAWFTIYGLHYHLSNIRNKRAQTPPRLLHCDRDRRWMLGKRSGAPCWVKIHHRKLDLRSVNGSEKLIPNPHLDPDQHQNLTTSRGSPIDHVYHVWSTSVTAVASYPAHSMTRWND